MQGWKKFASAAALSIAMGAQASQFSDLWWNPQESGWGANVVQQDDTVFVTLFVQAPDGAPVWYSGAARMVAIAPGNLPQFSGTLHRTKGPWFGGPFNPANVRTSPVGNLGIETLANDRMRLTYEVDGVSVTKDLVRQTFRQAFAGGNYLASFNLRQSLPGGAPFGTFAYGADVVAIVENAEAHLRVLNDFGRECNYRGAYAQAGKLTSVNGNFNCSDGTQGAFQITDLEVTAHGITGQLRTTSATLVESGRFAGARRL